MEEQTGIGLLASLFVSLSPGVCVKCDKETSIVLGVALNHNPFAENIELAPVSANLLNTGVYVCTDHLVEYVELFGEEFLKAARAGFRYPSDGHLH